MYFTAFDTLLIERDEKVDRPLRSRVDAVDEGGEACGPAGSRSRNGASSLASDGS